MAGVRSIAIVGAVLLMLLAFEPRSVQADDCPTQELIDDLVVCLKYLNNPSLLTPTCDCCEELAALRGDVSPVCICEFVQTAGQEFGFTNEKAEEFISDCGYPQYIPQCLLS